MSLGWQRELGKACQPARGFIVPPVCDRFTEGFETADLIAAKRLLDEPGDPGRS
jgi:hypothetical protein